jgi:preprotein translocase subunit SecY
MFQGDTSHLPLKLNTAGVIPPIFASSLLLLPATLAGFSNGTGDLPGGHRPCWRRWATASRPTWLFYALHDRLLRLLLHRDRVQSEGHRRQSQAHGGFIPGIRPGERTAKYIDFVLTRITVIGAACI